MTEQELVERLVAANENQAQAAYALAEAMERIADALEVASAAPSEKS